MARVTAAPVWLSPSTSVFNAAATDTPQEAVMKSPTDGLVIAHRIS